MNGNGLEKEKILMMLTDISLQLEKLEQSLESSFSTVRKDLYNQQLVVMESVGNRMNMIDKKEFNIISSSPEHPAGTLKLELGF